MSCSRHAFNCSTNLQFNLFFEKSLLNAQLIGIISVIIRRYFSEAVFSLYRLSQVFSCKIFA